MRFDDPIVDEYEEYESLFDPMQSDRRARRKRKKKAHHTPKKTRRDIIDDIADTIGLEGGFETTYKLTRYEEQFLLDSVRTFYDQSLITDILAQVKGGKEASVYRCAAHESTHKTYLAVKVYRPRKLRNLRNDKMYRQGRRVLKADGKEVQGRDQRILRAIGKKTSFGKQVAHTSWLMHEYNTLKALHEAGAAVPQPFGAGENAILMSYLGDTYMAAPTLHEVDLTPDEARPLFQEVIRNIDLMLQHNLIHGDLSAYNILYWEGKITLIDFPQVVNIHTNDQARFILQRDIQRVCDYFDGCGIKTDADGIFNTLWNHYVHTNPEDIAADLSVLLPDDDE